METPEPVSGPTVPVTARVAKETLDSISRSAAASGLLRSTVTRLVIEAGLANRTHLEKLLATARERRQPEPLAQPKSFSVPLGEYTQMKAAAEENGWDLAVACRRWLRRGVETRSIKGLVPPGKPLVGKATHAILPALWIEQADSVAARASSSRSSALRALVKQGLACWEPPGVPEPAGPAVHVAATLTAETIREMNRATGGLSVSAAFRQLVGRRFGGGTR